MAIVISAIAAVAVTFILRRRFEDCLSRIRGKAPKWSTMDGVRGRNCKRSARGRT